MITGRTAVPTGNWLRAATCALLLSSCGSSEPHGPGRTECITPGGTCVGVYSKVSKEECVASLEVESVAGLRVSLTSPDGSTAVGRDTEVKGVVSGLPSGHYLRVFVRPQTTSHWWPQKEPILSSDSSWSVQTSIGLDRGDAGKRFIIGVLAVTREERDFVDCDLTGLTRFSIPGAMLAQVTVIRE